MRSLNIVGSFIIVRKKPGRIVLPTFIPTRNAGKLPVIIAPSLSGGGAVNTVCLNVSGKEGILNCRHSCEWFKKFNPHLFN